jgi:flagellar hook-associated protein 2
MTTISSSASTPLQTSSATSATTAAKNSAGQQIISALGGGSGVDTKTLAQSLVNAEKLPQQNIIQSKIDKCNATISGDGALLASLGKLNTAFSALQNKTDLDAVSIATTDAASFVAKSTGGAEVGFHQIHVTAVAAAQRSSQPAGSGFADSTSAIASTGNLTITPAGKTPVTVAIVAGDSASAVVDKINKTPGVGVTATLVNTGSGLTPYQIVLTSSASGTANGFSVSGDMNFDNVITPATDAKLTVDGIQLTRSTNEITDAISGVNLSIFAAAPTGTDTYVQVSRDTTQIKNQITNLVSAYNELQKTLDTVTSPDSTDPNIGGSLANNSIVRTVRAQIQRLMMGDSSTPGAAVKAFRDLGVTIQSNGMMASDDAKLQASLDKSYADVVQALSGNIVNQSSATAESRGLAGDAVKILTALIDTNASTGKGAIAAQISGAKQKITTYNEDMQKLETRMSMLLERYAKQFAAMDTLLGSIKSQQTGLKSTFDGMAAMYSNN